MRVELASLVRKELRQTVQDRRMMALLVIAPFIQLVVLGFAVNFEVDRVPTVVVDQDDSRAGRALARRLLADGTLEAVARSSDLSEAMARIDAGTAAAVLVVPAGFSRDVHHGRPARVQLLLDGTDPNRAGVAAGAVQAFALTEMTGPRPMVASRALFNPGLETATYIVPGVAAMLLLLVTTVVSAMGLSRERQTGTLEQILVSPVSPAVVVAGKVLPFAAIGLLDFAVALLVATQVFDVPVRGSLFLSFAATLLYLLSTLGMGLLVATISRTQQQAFLGGFLLILPATLLSGILTPVRSMPEWLERTTLLNPARHYAEVIRAVLLKGAGLVELWPQLLSLTVIGAVVLTVAVARFRKTLE